MKFFRREDSAEATMFRDVILNLIATVIIIVYVMLPYFNPITELSTIEPPGELVFHIGWSPALNVDIDMWVKAPGKTTRAVGYSNKVSKLYALVRDDVGFQNDPSNSNYEFGYARKSVKGEWIVNLHYYTSHIMQTTPPVDVYVSITRQHEDSSTVWMSKTITLSRKGEEITAFRFKVDTDGNLVADSIGNRCVHLRAANRGTPC